MKPHYRWSWDENKPLLVCWVNRFGEVIVEPGYKVKLRRMLKVWAG